MCTSLKASVVLAGAGVVALVCLCPPAWTASLIVPDESPSIQTAIDADVDSVLVRPGEYAETPIVRRPVSLIGIGPGGESNILLHGLEIAVETSEGGDPLFEFRRLTVRAQVGIVSDAGRCRISFGECDLQGGIADRSIYLDTGSLTLRGCSLAGLSHLAARDTCELDSCRVTGGVLVGHGTDLVLGVRGCVFEGDGTGYAIGSTVVGACVIERNIIRRYEIGIDVSGETRAVARGNLVEDCSVKGLGVGQNGIMVENNIVRRCGVGVDALSNGSVAVRGNLVAEASGVGLHIAGGSLIEVSENVVWGCLGYGMKVLSDSPLGVTVNGNTSCFNGGSGFVCETVGPASAMEWKGNIGYENGAYGITWTTGEDVRVRCNNWFGNRSGDVEGRAPSGEDLSVDPLFCDAAGGDFRLRANSPLRDWPGCGQIGALGDGCVATGTVVRRFTAQRVVQGIRILWEVEGNSVVWIERSSNGGEEWVLPATERSQDDLGTGELDRGVVPDRPYWYRLVAREGDVERVIGAPIVVEALDPAGFMLTDVGPSPAQGLVRIAFAVKEEAEIEIDIFDVQGRLVVALARGVWPAGTHSVKWSSPAAGGRAPGVYVVRYRYPGGQDRRSFVRTP